MSEQNNKKELFEISESVVYATLEMAIVPALISLLLLGIQIALYAFYKQTYLFVAVQACFYFAAQTVCALLLYDKKLFKILFEETPPTDAFDKTLNIFWNKKIIPNKTVKSRLQGSARIIKISFLFILCQLITLLLYLL